MDDDTTGSFLRTSRHVSVWIEAAPEVVYEFASDPHEWRRWASIRCVGCWRLAVRRVERAERQPHDGARGRGSQHRRCRAAGRNRDDHQDYEADPEREQLVHRPGHTGDADFVAHCHRLTIARK